MVKMDTFVDSVSIKSLEMFAASSDIDFFFLSLFTASLPTVITDISFTIFAKRAPLAPNFAARAARKSAVSMSRTTSAAMKEISKTMDTVPSKSIQKNADNGYSSRKMMTLMEISKTKRIITAVMTMSKTSSPGSSGIPAQTLTEPPKSAMSNANKRRTLKILEPATGRTQDADHRMHALSGSKKRLRRRRLCPIGLVLRRE
mmetsp:Transcript_43034/g.98957  ORF Transcript_43034/g.98957 Transcript_43034/m.98957 type:complete len:202 (-) Transcript_43034:716-1321(-)